MKRNFLLIIATIVLCTQSCLAGCPGTANSTGNFINDTIPPSLPQIIVPPHGSQIVMGDFVTASKEVTPSVVHIKTIYAPSGTTGNTGGQIYGSSGKSSIAMGSGSGIIIEADGYMATNNHVVENAEEIEVILPDKRIFTVKHRNVIFSGTPFTYLTQVNL